MCEKILCRSCYTEQSPPPSSPSRWFSAEQTRTVTNKLLQYYPPSPFFFLVGSLYFLSPDKRYCFFLACFLILFFYESKLQAMMMKYVSVHSCGRFQQASRIRKLPFNSFFSLMAATNISYQYRSCKFMYMCIAFRFPDWVC